MFIREDEQVWKKQRGAEASSVAGDDGPDALDWQKEDQLLTGWFLS
jgi:hypothetical protein